MPLLNVLYIFSLLYTPCRAYLRDVVEMVHIFYKMMEKFCNGRVVVQDKSKPRRKKKQTKGKSKGTKQKKSADEERVSFCF